MARGIAVDLGAKFALFSDTWSPKVVETVDGYEVKLARLHGDFVWHSHAEADELFLVVSGSFRMDFRDCQVSLSQGQMLVVPRGVEHKPYAEAQCQVLLLERAGLVNTGDVPSPGRAAAVVEAI